MKKASSKSLTRRQRAELDALATLPEGEIDTIEMPEVRDWSGARRGAFYRPVKQQLTLRLDADVVAWFRAHAPAGAGYQTEINRALRDHVARQERKPERV
jgi:uncharacterized protein (DUF4415 family)